MSTHTVLNRPTVAYPSDARSAKLFVAEASWTADAQSPVSAFKLNKNDLVLATYSVVDTAITGGAGISVGYTGAATAFLAENDVSDQSTTPIRVNADVNVEIAVDATVGAGVITMLVWRP